MKMLQQNEETSVRCKSSTGNLFHSPMGVTDNSDSKSPVTTDIHTVEGKTYLFDQSISGLLDGCGPELRYRFY